MIADINESELLSVRTENEIENDRLKTWLMDNAKVSQLFLNCCNNKKCAFSFDLKDGNN
jgi:hypothetical protein